MKKLILSIALVSLAILAGCEMRANVTSSPSGDNVIERADRQRQAVIAQTRAASYSVLPDVKDPEILKDRTFLEAIIAEKARGSAFGVRADGIVMTNVHVVESACVPDQNPQLSDFFRQDAEMNGAVHCLLLKADSSKVYRAKVIQLDRENDIAALQIENSEETFHFLRIASQGTFGDGTEVFTIGAPLGNTNFMTPGYVSNVSFVMPTPEGSKKPARKLQFSAPILPGNSGGPLVSFATGEVVGQAVMIFMMGPIPTQMSYANPVEFLKKNLDSIPKKDTRSSQ